jgi:hypothetical protein
MGGISELTSTQYRMPRTICEGTIRERYSYEVLGHILKHQSLHSDDIITDNGVIVIHRDLSFGDLSFGHRQGKPECFLLLLNRDKSATLQSLSQADCSLDPNGTGRSIVNAILALARQHGAVRIDLMDYSKKRLANGKMFRLSNMYFLTMGETWYESIIPGLQPQEKETLIAEWRHRVMTNTWTDVVQRLDLSAVPLPVDISDIDVRKPGSAMIVLRRIKEAGTDFFADYEDELLIASNIGNLYGIAWSAPL